MTRIKQTVNRLIRRLSIRKKYKDALFRRCFEDKRDLLDLYNALNGTSYKDTDELKITTLEDCIYLAYKNDLSFILSATLNLYEHQSTYNPNMPVRGLIYFARIYEAYIKENKLSIYGKTLVKLPEPRYIVFYNGADDEPDRQELRLSDAFRKENDESRETVKKPALECVAVVLNIHYGHNNELLDKCKRLHDYAYFVSEVNRNAAKGYSYEKAIGLAMEYCEKNDILADILGKHRSEVLNLLLNEFDVKNYENWIRNESWEEGIQKGRGEGILLGKAYGIIELLEDFGEVPDSLKSIIMEEKNPEVLKRWHKAAAKAQSIKDFEETAGLIYR